MKLLAIETATEACSLALWIDGEVLERHEVAPRQHAALVLPWAEALLAEAGISRRQLDAVACGRGPGAFTGVRLAVALTQGIALALDLPAFGVSTLAALAHPVASDDVLASIDARMGEVYLGCFRREAGVLHAVGEERVLAPGDAAVDEGPQLAGVGTGFAAAQGALVSRLGKRLEGVDAAALPRASAVAALAAATYRTGARPDAAALQPAYLRNRVALNLAEQRQAREQAGTRPRS